MLLVQRRFMKRQYPWQNNTGETLQAVCLFRALLSFCITLTWSSLHLPQVHKWWGSGLRIGWIFLLGYETEWHSFTILFASSREIPWMGCCCQVQCVIWVCPASSYWPHLKLKSGIHFTCLLGTYPSGRAWRQEQAQEKRSVINQLIISTILYFQWPPLKLSSCSLMLPW